MNYDNTIANNEQEFEAQMLKQHLEYEEQRVNNLATMIEMQYKGMNIYN